MHQGRTQNISTDRIWKQIFRLVATLSSSRMGFKQGKIFCSSRKECAFSKTQVM